MGLNGACFSRQLNEKRGVKTAQAERHWVITFYSAKLRLFFFFFQAEDGIRDGRVTGVQTCALPISPQQLRDETMTLFLAGHETTALLLGWTWYLLGENPGAETRLLDELRAVLGGRAPQVSDLMKMPYLQAVLNETLRLYPPAYIMARTSIEPFGLGGYEFGRDTTVLISQWVTQRDARFFDAPEEFRPERWVNGSAGKVSAGAYFPFGDGPRRCIGQGFAMLEAALVVATIAQKFRFRLVPGHAVEPEPLVTLRFRHGLRMKIEART